MSIIRETPWSKITDIEVHDDYVEYTEVYDLKHPGCPVVQIKFEDNVLTYYAERKNINKQHFELIYGSAEKE